MNKFIVITSIFDPSEGVTKFSQLENYSLVVVGDKKSPNNWYCENATYLSVEKQKELGFSINEFLPYNHYSRKMLGYLYALANMAEIIIDSDDDNIPSPGWGFPDFKGRYSLIPGDLGFVNIYELYSHQKIWPRGFPLRLINEPNAFLLNDIIEQDVKIGVWQGLANEDPDVDAIYRLTSNQECIFEYKGNYVLHKGTISPFNSQNTAFIKELFVLLYLPAFVTFRFTDILRSLIAQPIMELYGYHLGFTGPQVIQKRNPHDYMSDFLSEIPMYLNTERISRLVISMISKDISIEDNLHRVYTELNKIEIVSKNEIICLEAWLNDYKKISS